MNAEAAPTSRSAWRATTPVLEDQLEFAEKVGSRDMTDIQKVADDGTANSR